jgi:hypothetical protein
LTGIKTRVDETVRFVHTQLAQDKILSKSMHGMKLESSIFHTKPKSKPKDQNVRGGNVFPLHNASAIGQITPQISKTTKQSHPGKATSNTKKEFCKWCGIEVGNLGQHETKTKLHIEGVKRNVEYVKCTVCNKIHPVGSC